MLSRPNILVGTDFSVQSDVAIRAAEVLSKKANGRLHVVHITQYPSEWSWMGNEMLTGYLPPSFTERYLDELRLSLKRQLNRLKIECSHEVMYGKPVSVLKELCHKKEFDMLVLGKEGLHGEHKIPGGLSSKLALLSEIPLLLVSNEFSPKKIAGLVDTQRAHPEIFRMGEELSFLLSTELVFVSLWKDIALEMKKRSLLAPSIEYRFGPEEKLKVTAAMTAIIKQQIDSHSKAAVSVGITEEDSIGESLVAQLSSENADLVIVLRHQKKLVERIVMGSVTRKIFETYQGNLLILPPPLN